MADKLGVFNKKGGVGKTGTLWNIAGFLSKYGYKTLLIDIDPQSNLTDCCISDVPSKTLLNLLEGEAEFNDVLLQPYADNESLKNIYLIPSTEKLYYSSMEDFKFQKLSDIFKEHEKYFHIILIDTNPSVSIYTKMVMEYVTHIIGVVDASIDSIKGMKYVINELMDDMSKELNPSLDLIGVLLNMSIPNTNFDKEMRILLAENFKDKVFDTAINRAVSAQEARAFRTPLVEYDKKSIVTTQYANVTGEILRRLRKGD